MFTRSMGRYTHIICALAVCLAFGVGCAPVVGKFLPYAVQSTPASSQPALAAPTSVPLRTATTAPPPPPGTRPPNSTPSATATPIPPRATPTLNSTPIFESPEFFVSALVRNEAIKHSGAAPSSVSIARIEAREWPDAGLGCGQPGQGYVQMTTPGWLVEARAGSKVLEYHTDQSANKIVLCQESG